MSLDPTLAVAVRLGVVAGAGLAILGGQRVVVAWQAGRRRRALTAGPAAQWASGAPQILVFTGTLCADCLVQKDVVNRLQKHRPIFDTQEVMAAQSPELTRRFRIQSVPATVLIDAAGAPTAVNYGLVDEATLSRQLDTLFATKTAAAS